MRAFVCLRRFVFILAVGILGAACVGALFGGCAREKDSSPDRVVLSAPFGPLAYPFIYMAGEADTELSYEFITWKNPDQLRAMITGRQAEYFAVPTNVAAIFHNKGADLSLVNVSVWNVLWIVSDDPARTSFEDFRGTELIMPFRGDMPHILFSAIARERGIDPEKDVNLRYVATPQDAVQQLLLGRAHHAVLCEPDLSILMSKAGDDAGFRRVVDIQREWCDIHGEGASTPIGGIAASQVTLSDMSLSAAFERDYARAVEWCVSHPEETGEIVSEWYDGVPAEPIAEALRNVDQHVETAFDARDKLQRFFSVLLEADPATVGGALPGDGFYRGGGR